MTEDGTQFWAIPGNHGGWRLICARRAGSLYSERVLTGSVPASQALAWLKQLGGHQ